MAPRHLLNRLIALLASMVAAGGLALAAAPSALAQDSAAVAVNTRDDSTVYRLALSIRRVMGDVVDQQNAAVAIASCQQCEAAAVSIQVVLAMDAVDVITPVNLAIAENVDCQTCVTIADAYQYVFGQGEPVRFTADGNEALAQLRRELESLRTAGLTPDAFQAQVESLAAQVWAVVTSDLVPAGPPANAAPLPSQQSPPATSPPTATDTGTTSAPPASDSGTTTGDTNPPPSTTTTDSTPTTTTQSTPTTTPSDTTTTGGTTTTAP